MNKLWISLLLLSIIGSAGYAFVKQIEEKQTYKVALDSATKTIQFQSEENAKKERININRETEILKLERRNNEAKIKISKLKRTKKQIECDNVSLPDGYFEFLYNSN